MKKRILAGIVAIVIIVVASASYYYLTLPSGPTTLVFNMYGGAYEGAFRNAYVTPFEQKYNCKIEFATGTMSDWYTKIDTANGVNPPYDFGPLDVNYYLPLINKSLIEGVPQAQLPNLSNLFPEAIEKGCYIKDGKVYVIVSPSFGSIGIAYRTDKVTNPPTKWSDFWKSEYKGNILISPLTFGAGLQMFVGTIREMGGHENNETDVAKAFQMLQELKPNIAIFSSSSGELTNYLTRGDIAMCAWWDGRVLGLQTQGVPVNFSIPQGATYTFGNWVIYKGTKNYDLCVKFMNWMMDPQPTEQFDNQLNYYSPNRLVTPNVNVSKLWGMLPQQALQTYSQMDYAYITAHLDDWVTRWNSALGT